MKSKVVSIKDILAHPNLSLSAKDYIVEVPASYEFSLQDISDILVTAFEGGINYWCRLAEIKDEPPADLPYVFASDVIGLGGTLLLHDIENEDEKWELNLEKLMEGIKKYCHMEKCTPGDMLENLDADVADCIVQFAVLGEITFG